MSGHGWSIVIGLVMTISGLVLYFVFHDVVTPVVGLRQLGLVLVVLGAVEVVVSGVAARRR